jgi:type I restriction enzyme S subunit
VEIKQGYKQTEVGTIPKDWEVKSLGSLASIATGGTPPTRDVENYGEDFLFVSPVDLGFSKYISRTEKMLSNEGFSISRHFPKGSILFVCIGSTIGKCGIASITLTSNQQINAIFPSVDLSTEYLYYAVSKVAPKVKSLAGEQAVPIVNKTQFSETLIPLPPTLAEQQAIAEALSDADALIESLEQLIAKKRQIKLGAMQELLTGKKRLPEFTNIRHYRHTDVGMIPDDWNEVTLSYCCDIVAARDLVKEDYSATSDDKHKYTIFSNALSNKGLYGYSQSYQFEKDKVTVTARGDIGHAVYRNTRFCAIGRLLVLTAKQKCDLRFIADYINNCVDFALESTGVPQLTAPQISKYKIALPPTFSEQKDIANILSDMEDEIASLNRELAKFQNIKQGMMQELLTGMIRLV